MNSAYRADPTVDKRSEANKSVLTLLAILQGGYGTFVMLAGGMLGFASLQIGLLSALGLPVMTRTNGVQHIDPDSGTEAIVLGVVALVAVVSAILHLLAAFFLASRKAYVFLWLLTCVFLISIPFGTVLGVLTWMALKRPGAKELFGRT